MKKRLLVNSITKKQGEYWYAGIAVYDSVIDGGKGELLYKKYYPDPFVNLKTARKHAEFAAYEVRNKA